MNITKLNQEVEKRMMRLAHSNEKLIRRENYQGVPYDLYSLDFKGDTFYFARANTLRGETETEFYTAPAKAADEIKSKIRAFVSVEGRR